MSSETEGRWERGRGAGTRDGALPPVITELRTRATMVVVVGGGGCGVLEKKGHTEHAGNSVPFTVPSERAQLTPGTNKSRGMRPS